MIDTTTTLNKVGSELARDQDVHAITDVTGFGVLGHALELARGSKLTVRVKAADVPLLKHAAQLTQQGFVTGASHRNWASYGHDVVMPKDLPEWQRHLLADPVNAMVSFAYTMLARTWLTVLSAVGFDPYLGFRRKPRFGRAGRQRSRTRAGP